MTATPAAPARDLLSAGDPAAALKALQQQVRAAPADPALRVFLFQLLCVLGKWPRALEQLQVCGQLDAGTLAMVNTYRAAVHCESVREAVFAGRQLPHVFGPPTAWVALLAQALQLDGEGHAAQAADLRARAFDEAEATAGRLDGEAFSWIADADSRLGPVLEVIINGRYGWLPFAHLQQLDIEAVSDLRDLVWAPADLVFVNGGGTVALLPVRYAGSVDGGAAAGILMSRQTEWLSLTENGDGDDEPAPQYRGLGQRMLVTDVAEQGLLAVRQISFTPQAD